MSGSVGDATEPKLSGAVREGICEADTARTGSDRRTPKRRDTRQKGMVKSQRNKARQKAQVSNPRQGRHEGSVCLADPGLVAAGPPNSTQPNQEKTRGNWWRVRTLVPA